jgi:hypothetical protein
MATPILASALQGVKLKPSKIEKDASAPLFEGTMEREGLNDYHTTILDMNIELWYDAIAEYTFPTQFFELTVDTAKLLISAYDTLILQKSKLSEDQSRQLKALEDGLQAVIDAVRGEDEFVFVKTSCRSPKDTVVYSSRFKQLYRESLAQKPSRTENDKLVSLLDAAIDLLKTRSAKELLDTFISSERIYQDMSVATSHPDRFNQHFAVRKWITVPPSMEFRGFFNNGKLNALSQYNHCCFYPQVANHAESLVKNIQEFFSTKVQLKLDGAGIKACIVDFAVTDPSNNTIYVIELNPFVYTTDGCMFSWTHEQHILENGPFEFRYQTKEPKGSLVAIADAWKKVVEDEDALFAAGSAK